MFWRRLLSDLFRVLRKLLVSILVIAALITVANYVPLLRTSSDQDNCSFGPVSNEQYRSYLSQVKERQRTMWAAFTNNPSQIARELNFRLNDMIGADNSVYVRLAMMHAILRGVGAEFLNTDEVPGAAPYEMEPRYQGSVGFNYWVDINRLGFFQPYPRTIWIPVTLMNPQRAKPDILERYGLLHIAAHFSSIFDHPPGSTLMSTGQRCPPSPSAAIASRYEVR